MPDRIEAGTFLVAAAATRGLFGLGTVKGNAVNATMHFDNIMIEESQLDPDISAPIFQGIVNEVTLKTGDTFDPLAGVTAIDARDGDLTSEIEVKIYNSLNELVSEVDTSIEANYRIVYIVSDSSGNFRTQEVLLAILGLTTTDTGKILNGDFAGADLTPWTSWGQDWGAPAEFVTALTNGTATIDITNPGSEGQPWTIQFIQADVLLEQGDTYVLSFDAKASVERDIGVVFYNADTQINYLNVPSVALTTEMASFEFMFTMTNADILTQLQFLMGTTTNYAAGMVTLDNVMLSTVDQEALLKNSDFTDIGFYTWGQDWGAPAEYTFAIENEMFVFDVTNPGSEGQPWTIQFNQSLGSKLEAETTYVLTFDAYADVARDINALVLHPTTYARHGELVGQMLTTSAQTYTLEFTTLADNLDTVNLSFELGTTAAYAAGKVYFDNISLVVKDETTELINNGAANPAYGWTFYNEGAGQGTMAINNGTLEINVTGLDGAAYQPHFYQMIETMEPGTYHLVFSVNADVARNLRINMVLPDAGYASIFDNGFVDFLTSDSEVVNVVVEFTVTSTLTNVKFELDFGTLGGDLISLPGTFTIQEILLYKVFNQ
jgi:hypothetical protein